jgi:hypothetical protein
MDFRFQICESERQLSGQAQSARQTSSSPRVRTGDAALTLSSSVRVMEARRAFNACSLPTPHTPFSTVEKPSRDWFKKVTCLRAAMHRERSVTSKSFHCRPEQVSAGRSLPAC